MTVADKIQAAWQKQAKWLILLRPLSLLYHQLFLWQKNRQQQHAYKAPVPVMIIGNITVGGSGKTPLIIQLVKYLQQHKIRVGVISRGYGGKGRFPARVTPDSLASEVGDEPKLIVNSTGVPMAVGPNRQAAIELLLQFSEVDIILSDDGLQHFALQRDIEWVVIDTQRGFGNKKLLPEGFLREPLSRLDSVTVIEHNPTASYRCHMHLEVGQIYNLCDPTLIFDNTSQYYAVVGIGFPQRFLNTLDTLKITYMPCVFADHHDYQASDFEFDESLPIITTSKDAVKLQELWHHHPEWLKRIWVVPVNAVLSEACYAALGTQLQQFNIRIEA